MMQDQQYAPWGWLRASAWSLQWPIVVAAAFWLGRYCLSLEQRLVKAEGGIDALVCRHLPAVHRALADIRAMLQSERL